VNHSTKIRGRRRQESGTALLIALFSLLLVAVVAIAMVIASGTESSLSGNYKSATTVYYAARAGLEEARGRMHPKNPDYLNKGGPIFNGATFIPPATMQLTEVRYIINDPGASPNTPGNPYYDQEYFSEFNVAIENRNVFTIPSVSGVSGTQGPPYKWVRINPITEAALKTDVNADNTQDPITPLFYDKQHVDSSGATPVIRPGLIFNPALTANPGAVPSAVQAFEITSLAVLPNGSQKMLQYIVAGVPFNIPIPAALTLSGSNGNPATFKPPASTNTQFAVSGMDHDCNGNSLGIPKLPAIGVFPGTDIAGIKAAIPTANQPQYTGSGGTTPDIEDISALFPPNLMLPSQLDALAQSIIQNADAVVPQGTSWQQTSFLTSLNMSPSNPLVVVANGNLDITNWSHDGYGLLLVTGTFTYDPDTNWFGLILVIGAGNVGGDHMQYKTINGAMLVAQTRHSDGSLLPDAGGLGGATVSFASGMQGNGIAYSSCWAQRVIPTPKYSVISFHEIAQ
jgi:hypothetical protein